MSEDYQDGWDDGWHTGFIEGLARGRELSELSESQPARQERQDFSPPDWS